MGLTKMEIDHLPLGSSRYLKHDGNGLYLEVFPNGNKFWRLRFNQNGKQKNVALGRYPTMGLKEARLASVKARDEASRGRRASNSTFEVYARDWLARYVTNKVALSTQETILSRLELHVLPALGAMPITAITVKDVNALTRRLEAAGKVPTARRCASIVGRIIRYAIGEGEEMGDPTSVVSDRLEKHKTEHFAALVTKAEVGELMRNIGTYQTTLTKMALLFTAYTFCRQNEIRFARWEEFNLEDKVWRIPANRMKARRTHIVPLSNQAIKILEVMKVITEGKDYVFPSQRDFSKPMSENCLLKAIRKWYTREKMTPHGFRATASTLLNESGFWHVNAIELQLAHSDMDTTRASYNYARLLPERTAMMQWYADLLDSLRDGKPVPAKPDFVTLD